MSNKNHRRHKGNNADKLEDMQNRQQLLYISLLTQRRLRYQKMVQFTITAEGKGKEKITVKIKLAGGKVKTVKKNIIVK